MEKDTWGSLPTLFGCYVPESVSRDQMTQALSNIGFKAALISSMSEHEVLKLFVDHAWPKPQTTKTVMDSCTDKGKGGKRAFTTDHDQKKPIGPEKRPKISAEKDDFCAQKAFMHEKGDESNNKKRRMAITWP